MRECAIGEQESARIKEKYAELKEKYEKLKSECESLRVRNQILEQQSKFIDAMKATAVAPQVQEDVIPSAQVSHILEEFDSILESQGREIAQLMDDRDKLAAICFQCVTAMAKIKVSAPPAAPPVAPAPSNGLDDVVRELGIEGGDGDALKAIREYLEQQKEKSNASNEKKRKLQMKLATIYKALRSDGQMSAREAVAEIGRLKRAAKTSNKVANDVVAVFEAFCNRYPTHKETNNCQARIQSWMENHDSGIDVVQEIDFLLGMCSILSCDAVFDEKPRKRRHREQ